MLGYTRIITNSRYGTSSATLNEAWSQVNRWLSFPNVWIAQPTSNHVAVLKELSFQTAAKRNLLMDAHLAALAIEHGLILCSTDTDFSRFQKLRWENPLMGG
ncbi:MAG: TA system VapC family ribonuclease toxin [Opitutales bacterium]